MVVTGLKRFLDRAGKYGKRRIGLIANQTSVDSALRYSWEALARRGMAPVRIFSPEHGLFGTEQDQIAAVEGRHGGIEVVSLYGGNYGSLIPEPGMLDDLDLVLFDIQDIGARYYTFVNTMALFMRELHGRDIEFMVLDRPNPIGGDLVEGPMLESGYGSFVGVMPVPVRHGMTAGELALLYRDVTKIDISLTVMEMEGWERSMRFADTGLAWIPPSPNMPTLNTALVYPGMCLLEGTNVSEGRGTTTPFENFGAPFAEAERLVSVLNGYDLPGVFFRPVRFKPTFHKFAGRSIDGAFIHVTDPRAFRPFLTGVAVVKAYHDLCGEFAFLRASTMFNDTHPAFDLLTGGPGIREAIEKGLEP
jgi:uncharacterized protein YbbC (DUF1343 family)